MECESVIREGRAAFVRVGSALARIRDSKLYREKYQTFKIYCDQVWDMSDRHAQNLWWAADVVEELQKRNFVLLPATESQARPLFKLPREEWGPAWEEVTMTAPEGKVTANLVATVVQRFMERLQPIKARGPLQENAERAETEISSASSAASCEKPVPKPAATAAPVIDVELAGTREQKKRELAKQAQKILTELERLIGMADAPASSKVSLAVRNIYELQDHLERMEKLHESRKEPKRL